MPIDSLESRELFPHAPACALYAPVQVRPSETVRISRATERIQQITGYLPALIVNTEGGYLAVAMFGEHEVLRHGASRLEALERLVEHLEGPHARPKPQP